MKTCSGAARHGASHSTKKEEEKEIKTMANLFGAKPNLAPSPMMRTALRKRATDFT